MALQKRGFLWDRTPEEQNNVPSTGNAVGGYGYQPPPVDDARMSTIGGLGSYADAPVDCRFTTLQAEANAAAVKRARTTDGL